MTSLDCAVFGMTAGILVFEVALFSVFGKADIQVGCIISKADIQYNQCQYSFKFILNFPSGLEQH